MPDEGPAALSSHTKDFIAGAAGGCASVLAGMMMRGTSVMTLTLSSLAIHNLSRAYRTALGHHSNQAAAWDLWELESDSYLPGGQ
jgi:hypothetical protein